ncbi:MAG: glycosyltransferase [Candidatus Levybacteria bacterium]|nr:glycosyltransferase [Candidatus Levybacteria bacterium]
MRIGILDPYLDTLSGGEKYMLSIASCLAKENEVFIFWNKEEEAEIRQTTVKKLGIDLSSIKFYNNIFNKNVSFVPRYLESRKFDVIIYLSDGSIPLVGTKLFVHFQFPIEWVDGRSIKNKIKLFFIKKIFCNSYFTKSFIDKKLNVKSDVLYPPVNLSVVKNIKKENVILHVGRFDVNFHDSNYKKQDIMIDIFKKMIDAGLRNWKFKLIVGVRDGDEEKLNKLRAISEGYPIELIANIPNQKLWEYYSKAKIYWHATGYGEDLQKYPEKAEHFGITTVEAMGSGCVPVVFNAGGQKEIVEDNKNGYLCNNMEDFIFKTNVLIKDENLLEKMSIASKKRSDIFSGDRFCNDLRKILK